MRKKVLNKISNYKDHNDVDDDNDNVKKNKKQVRDTTDKEPQGTPSKRQKIMKRKYKCQFCNREFAYNKNKLKHIQNIHLHNQ